MQLSVFLTAGECDLPVTSAFEDWCDERGVHPEALGAWKAYEQSHAGLRKPPAL